mgnify:CR=1 FL=1
MIFFYNIYTTYSFVQNYSFEIAIGILVSLFIIIVPIAIMADKGDRFALQHGMIFARYSTMACIAFLAIIFSNSLKKLSELKKLPDLQTLLSTMSTALTHQRYKIAALLIGVGFIIWAIYFTFSQVPQEIIEKIFKIKQILMLFTVLRVLRV